MFLFKQKTAYEMRISDWSSDVCSSDLQEVQAAINAATSLLPKDLPAPPIYNKVNPADTAVISLAVTSPTLPLYQVRDLIDIRVAQKLSQISDRKSTRLNSSH